MNTCYGIDNTESTTAAAMKKQHTIVNDNAGKEIIVINDDDIDDVDIDGADDDEYVNFRSPSSESFNQLIIDVTSGHRKNTQRRTTTTSVPATVPTLSPKSATSTSISLSPRRNHPSTTTRTTTTTRAQLPPATLSPAGIISPGSVTNAAKTPTVSNMHNNNNNTTVYTTESNPNQLSKVRSDISLFSNDDTSTQITSGTAGGVSSMLLSPPIVFKKNIMKKIAEEKKIRNNNNNNNNNTIAETIPEETIFKDDRYAYYDNTNTTNNATNFFSSVFGSTSNKVKKNPNLKPIGFNKKRYMEKMLHHQQQKQEEQDDDEQQNNDNSNGHHSIIPASGSIVSMISRNIITPLFFQSSKDKYHNDTMVSQLSTDYNIQDVIDKNNRYDINGHRIVDINNNNNAGAAGTSTSNYIRYDDNDNNNKNNNNLDEIINARSIDSKDTNTTAVYEEHGYSIDKSGTITSKPIKSTSMKNNSSHYTNYGAGTTIPSKVPSGRCYKIRSCLCSNGFIYLVLFVLTITGLLYGVVEKLHLIDNPFRVNWDIEINVAFVGNAYFYVNDIPRLMETISSGHVHQQSCIHAGGSLSDLWMTGNGMYKLWSTDEALITNHYDPTTSYNASLDGEDGNDNNNNNNNANYVSVYDYGMCTVAQLILGSDEYISYGNNDGQYYNDGLNPCIIDQYYTTFLDDQKNYLMPLVSSWDFIILADQTKRMAIEDARNVSIQVLAEGYGPLIASSTGSPIPVIVDTHAFWSDSSNMTGLSDIPTFTSLIYDGIADYIDALKQVLPRKQYPIVAPVGLAFLTIWEENYDLWVTLFIDDMIHPSIRGSYLFGIVLYTTLFGHLPDPTIVRNSDIDTSTTTGSSSDTASLQYLFQNARKLLGNSNNNGASSTTTSSSLTADEIDYLLNVARRVALRGHVPKSFYYTKYGITPSSSNTDTSSANEDYNDRYRRILQQHHNDRIDLHQQQKRKRRQLTSSRRRFF